MRWAVIVSISALLSCDDGPSTPADEPALRVLTPIDRVALVAEVGRLSHDSMGGRGSGTSDERRAADYIAAVFQGAGLRPPGLGYLMEFAIPPALVQGRTGATSQNVIGIIPGSGNLRGEWLVLGAHYDHVGRRPDWTGALEVYNGADDNASGTALLIEVAKHISTYLATGGAGNRARRSIMFLAFGAEEIGLLGSQFYCAQPTYPLNTVVAMLNFDMVGRMADRTLRLGGLSTAAVWPELITEHNRDNLAIVASDCAGCTDHVCFRGHQRPALWFFTGLHEDYHQSTDDVERINIEGLGQIADLAARLTIDLALRPSAPTFAH